MYPQFWVIRNCGLQGVIIHSNESISGSRLSSLAAETIDKFGFAMFTGATYKGAEPCRGRLLTADPLANLIDSLAKISELDRSRCLE